MRGAVGAIGARQARIADLHNIGGAQLDRGQHSSHRPKSACHHISNCQLYCRGMTLTVMILFGCQRRYRLRCVWFWAHARALEARCRQVWCIMPIHCHSHLKSGRERHGASVLQFVQNLRCISSHECSSDLAGAVPSTRDLYTLVRVLVSSPAPAVASSMHPKGAALPGADRLSAAVHNTQAVP
jgi:hypothetical protein